MAILEFKEDSEHLTLSLRDFLGDHLPRDDRLEGLSIVQIMFPKV